MKWIFAFFLTLFSFSLHAQWFNWEARMGNTSDEMQNMAREMDAKGFSPGVIHAVHHDGREKFASVWRKYPMNAAWQFRSNLDAGGLQQMTDEMSSRGFSPVDISVYVINGQTRFSSLWSEDRNTAYQCWWGIRAGNFKSYIDSFSNLGYRLTDLDGYVLNGERYFSAIWKRFSGVQWKYVFGYDENSFEANFREEEDRGYIPSAINVFTQNGRPVFSAVYIRSDREEALVSYAVHENNLQSLVDDKVEKGYAISDVDSYVSDGELYYALVFSRLKQQQISRSPVSYTDPIQSTQHENRQRILSIAPVQQQTLVWCWLAVGEMIFRHYGIPNRNAAGNYQCGIIGSLAFVSRNCAYNCFDNACRIPSGSNYNTTRMLRDYAWTAAGRVFNCTEGREMSFDAIRRNIDQSKPIVAGVSYYRRQYYGGAEHAVLITGYEENANGQFLIINDPFPYEAYNNPYIIEGGTRISQNQYKISLRAFTERVFWHWSLSDISIRSS